MFIVNKRLDEWVHESWLDTRKVQFPRRDGAQTGGTTTPKKTHIGSGGGVMPNFLSMCVLLLDLRFRQYLFFYIALVELIFCNIISG